jgi:cysteine-rich repeat protein
MTPDTAPAPPSGLLATPVSASQINLSWIDHADNENAFVVERKVVTGPWASLGGNVGIVLANVTTFPNSGLQPVTTYSYRVYAINDQGLSLYSNEVTAVTQDGPPSFPYALSATQKVPASAFEINLAWADGSHNESGFRIERKTGTTGVWESAGLVGAGIRTFKDTAAVLTSSATYYYRVFAYNALGDSPASNLASVVTTDIIPSNPQNPTSATVSSSAIRIAWTDVSQNETGFRITYRKGATGTWSQQDIAANLTEHTITGLDPNTTYSFLVQAFNNIGVSYSDTQVTATTFDVPPQAPTALSAAALSRTQIRLTWTDNSPNNTHFSIERKTGAAGTWTEVRTAGANDNNLTDAGLTVNTTYYYRIKAVNAVGDSDFSNEVNALTYDVAPAAPSRLRAMIVRESDLVPAKVNLSWIDNALNEAGFTIERKTGVAGTYASVGTVALDMTTYLNTTNVVGGSTYYFRVKATNAGGSSGYSNEVGITIAKPIEPQTPGAFALSDTEIRVSWSIWWQSNNVAEVRVKRAGSLIATIPFEDAAFTGNMSYTDTGLTPNTTYVYGLETCNAYGCSAWLYPITATTRATFCPNGKKEAGETCDDGNSSAGDGCSGCSVESGFTCNGTTPSICQKCGNGIREGTEICDDTNTNPRDGCSAICTVETEWICTEMPSVCVRDLKAIVRRLMNIGPTAIPTLQQRVVFFSAMLQAEKSQNLPFDVNANGVVNRQDTRLLLEGLRQIMGR